MKDQNTSPRSPRKKTNPHSRQDTEKLEVNFLLPGTYGESNFCKTTNNRKKTLKFFDEVMEAKAPEQKSQFTKIKARR